MKKIINNIEYDLTAEEIAQREQDAIQAEQNRLTQEVTATAKAAAEQSAINKLKALGLTDAEVEAFIG